MASLNHVINLAVDDFMKAIKGYMEETEDYLHDVDDDDPVPVEMRVEGVMSTVFKLRIIGKVESLYRTHQC